MISVAKFPADGEGQIWPWFRRSSTRYMVAAALAAAQVLRIPIQPPTLIPFITYAPFIVASALFGGLGPGLVTTVLCSLEVVYFALAPVGSFAVSNPVNWHGLVALAVTGVVASMMAERLRRSGEQLLGAHGKTTSILEGISEGFISFDQDWHYTHVNTAAAKMAGKKPEDLLGKNVWESWPHAADSPFGAAFRRAVTENIPVRVEAFSPEPLNAWFEARCYPSPAGLSLFFTNTTERKRSEEQLRLVESAILQTSDGVVIVKVTGEDRCCQQPVFVNPAFERLTGYSLDDMRQGALPHPYRPGKNLHSLEGRSPGFLENCCTHLEQLVDRRDGSHFWAEWDFKPLADAHGDYTHCVWTCRDITDRKNSEETSQFLSAIVRSSDDAIIGVSPDGEVLTWNKGAEQIYGYTSVEIVGQPISLTVPPDRRDESRRIVEGLKRGLGVEHYETERVKKEGQRIFVALTVSPIKDATGKVIAGSAVTRDVTERRQNEEQVARLNRELEERVVERTTQLQAANQELDAFAHSISHDLRAPLRAIDGFSRILLEDYGPQVPEEAQRYLNIVRKNALQMGDLIESLLAFSRLGRQAMTKEFVDMGTLVREALESLCSECEGRQTEILIDELPACDADKALLKQVLVNLLSNALKYTRSRNRAKIEVGALRTHGGLDRDATIYYVRDNGAGFDMRFADKLFGVFQRLHRAEEYEGTGVGLALVHRIVTRHGGRVWAEAAVDQGATFYFTLTAAELGARNVVSVTA
jgi:PAS domain S-box-containing protein